MMSRYIIVEDAVAVMDISTGTLHFCDTICDALSQVKEMNLRRIAEVEYEDDNRGE